MQPGQRAIIVELGVLQERREFLLREQPCPANPITQRLPAADLVAQAGLAGVGNGVDEIKRGMAADIIGFAPPLGKSALRLGNNHYFEFSGCALENPV